MFEIAALPAPRFDAIPFAGAEILAARIDDQVRVPMKPLCAAIGLPWEPQRKRIMRDPVLAKGASMMEVPSRGGAQRQLTLPLELLAGFLFTAEADRYAPGTRERVHLFRERCFAVLHDHFFTRRQVGPAIDPATTAALARETTRAVQSLRRETSPRLRRLYHDQLERLCLAQGFDAPPVDAIGADALPSAELVARFLRGLETLTMMGVVWNHGATPGRIAFDLAEVLAEFGRLMIPMPSIAIMARALRDHGPIIDATEPMISNITGRHHLCWVFEEGAA